MSDLMQLKSQCQAAASDCENTAGTLGQVPGQINDHVAVIDSLISGTANQADQAITALLSAAADAVEDAVAQLLQAAQACSEFAQQL